MHSRFNQNGRADYLAMILIMAVSLACGLLFIVNRPDLCQDASYVLGESGNQLFRAARIHDGAVLYRDLACQYGALPVYLHAAFTKLFGVTIKVNLMWHLLTSVIAVGAAYLVMRKVAGIGCSVVVMLVFGIPMLLAPGGTLGGYTNVEYTSIERCCLLGVLWLWKPLGSRCVRDSILIGATLSIWQHVKFGGAVFAIAALFTNDVTAWCFNRGLSSSLTRSWKTILLVFGLFELITIGIAYTFLTEDLAFDTVFPAYMTAGYPSLGASDRFPRYSGISFFVTRQIPFTLCVTAGICVLIGAFSRLRIGVARVGSETENSRAIAAALFYLFACTAYLAHEHLYYQYAWVLLFPAALLAARLNTFVRLGSLAFAMAAPLLMTKVILVAKPSLAAIQIAIPHGDIVFVSESERDEIEIIQESISKLSDGDTGTFILASFCWGGGGVHHFYNSSYDLRNYLILPPAFRPYDEAELLKKLPRISAILVHDFKNNHELPEYQLRYVFSPATVSRIFREYDKVPSHSIDKLTLLVRRSP